ncbi:MAG: DUF368 domain-containing protein [Trueperella sp.]|nr:DUF368 domain-containing protein [Trueperella sp.]
MHQTSRLLQVVVNAIRGALIGMAELVPGVSGGTIALLVGVYERVLAAGMEILGLIKAVFTDRASLRSRVRRIDWWLIIPLLLGMAACVFSMAAVLSEFVGTYPHISRALFFGMVVVSIYVPLSMIDRAELRTRPWLGLLGLAAAVLTFVGTGYTAVTQTNPSYLVIFFAAAIAVCALVLPGVSGSYFLLAVGLYKSVMDAVADRDIPVLLVFLLGGITGITLFINMLHWLLNNRRTATLLTMAGLMAGSLRALWPWQTADAALLAPAADWPAMLGWAVLGAAIVALILLSERWAKRRAAKTE